MKIGVLSDTHGTLPEAVFTHLADCHEIWHAGDIGSLEVTEKLAAFKPLRAVYGNIDDATVRQRYPKACHFICQNLQVCIIHIAGRPPVYNADVQKIIHQKKPDILVCGHTHILRVERDKKNNLLYINPGAIGNYGMHPVRTMISFDITDRPCNMQVIKIGDKRF